MPAGAAHRFVDGVENLTAANVNQLDQGANVYHSPDGGLNYRVSAGRVWLQGPGVPVRFDYAGVATDQVLTPSVTTYLWIDNAGALASNETGWPEVPHVPLAEVVTDGSTVSSVTDRRPSLVLPGSVDRRQLVSGTYVGPSSLAPATTMGLTAETIYGIPFEIMGRTSIDRIAVEVTTLDVGSLIRLGLYREHASNQGKPGAQLEDLGTVSGTTTGIKPLVVTPDRWLAPGRYYVALVADSAVLNFRATAQGSRADLGWPGAAADFAAGTATSHWRGANGGQATSAALPDPFPVSPVAVADDVPFLAFRIA